MLLIKAAPNNQYNAWFVQDNGYILTNTVILLIVIGRTVSDLLPTIRANSRLKSNYQNLLFEENNF